MLAARFRVVGTVDQLHQPVNQEAGAFAAKAGFTQIERFENTPPYDIPLYSIGMMIRAINLHHPGEHGSVAFYLLCGDLNHDRRIS